MEHARRAEARTATVDFVNGTIEGLRELAAFP